MVSFFCLGHTGSWMVSDYVPTYTSTTVHIQHIEPQAAKAQNNNQQQTHNNEKPSSQCCNNKTTTTRSPPRSPHHLHLHPPNWFHHNPPVFHQKPKSHQTCYIIYGVLKTHRNSKINCFIFRYSSFVTKSNVLFTYVS